MVINSKEDSVHMPGLKEELFFFFSGIVTSVPLTFFVMFFTDSLCVPFPLFIAQICSVVCFTPFVEEFAKAYPLFYRHGESVRSMFVLGFLVGLGFGVAEFLLYVFVYNVPWFVRVHAVFFHACSTSIVAYGIRIGRAGWFYLLAVMLHLAINFAATTSLWLATAGALVVTYFLTWYLYKQVF